MASAYAANYSSYVEIAETSPAPCQIVVLSGYYGEALASFYENRRDFSAELYLNRGVMAPSFMLKADIQMVVNYSDGSYDIHNYYGINADSVISDSYSVVTENGKMVVGYDVEFHIYANSYYIYTINFIEP